VFNLYCDSVGTAVTIGIKYDGWQASRSSQSSQQEWNEFTGTGGPGGANDNNNNNPRTEVVRSLQDIIRATTPRSTTFAPSLSGLSSVNNGRNGRSTATAVFSGISIPVSHVRYSPCLSKTLLQQQHLLDQYSRNGTIRITGRYGHPLYATAQLIDGCYHSSDNNLWYVGIDSSKQRWAKFPICHLEQLSGIEVYVGGVRIGRFDGEEVVADNLEPVNPLCRVWEIHPVGLCLTTIGIYGGTNADNKLATNCDEDKNNSSSTVMMDDSETSTAYSTATATMRTTKEPSSMVELRNVIVSEQEQHQSGQDEKTVAFFGVSLPVRHVKCFPCMPDMLRQADALQREIKRKGHVRITGRHGFPVYAQTPFVDNGRQSEQSGVSERWIVDFDINHENANDRKQQQCCRCSLADMTGIEVSVAGACVARFDREVYLHPMLDNNHNDKTCSDSVPMSHEGESSTSDATTTTTTTTKLWEVSCDGIAGMTIAVDGLSPEQWARRLGSSDPRVLGILDLREILNAVYSYDDNVAPATNADAVVVSFRNVKLRVDDRFKRRILRNNGGSGCAIS